MKVVVSVNRAPGDRPVSRARFHQVVRAAAREALDLLEQWPDAKWMTVTRDCAFPERKEKTREG